MKRNFTKDPFALTQLVLWLIVVAFGALIAMVFVCSHARAQSTPIPAREGPVELIPGVMITYSDSDADVILIESLTKVIDFQEIVRIGSPKKNYEKDLTTEGKVLLAFLEAMNVEINGKKFEIIKGVGFFDPFVVVIRKRIFFEWSIVMPRIVEAYEKANFAVEFSTLVEPVIKGD